VHDSDHDGVVRIFVGLSSELLGSIIYLHYAEQFFPYQECNHTLQEKLQLFLIHTKFSFFVSTD